jgi:mannosyltransferase
MLDERHRIRGVILPHKRWQRSAPWLLTLLGLLARIFRVEANGFRNDEMYSLWMASHSLPELLRRSFVYGDDATPPTFYALLHVFMLIGRDPWAVRLVSVLAGTALVWVTFELAHSLFDLRTAVLSGLLMSISPFSIEYAQVARAYTLAAVLAVVSVYLFSRLPLSRARPVIIWLYVVSTLTALATHYVTGIIVIFENLIVAVLFAARWLSRRDAWQWFRPQVLLGVLALPLIWLALPMVSNTFSQSWLPIPSLEGIVRTMILWATGDPSYGPAGFTYARLASLILIAGLLGLGALAARRLWRAGASGRQDVLRASFVAAAAFVPWMLALVISLRRPIFNPKYFLFSVPFWLILFAWSITRIRPAILSHVLLVALLGLTGLSLAVYYTSPTGEQWSLAMAALNQLRRPEDYVVVSPGFYIQPVEYYLLGKIASFDDSQLERARIVILDPLNLMSSDPVPDAYDLPGAEETLAEAPRVWFVTGWVGADADWLAWFTQHYTPSQQWEFLGVNVVFGERKSALGKSISSGR